MVETAVIENVPEYAQWKAGCYIRNFGYALGASEVEDLAKQMDENASIITALREGLRLILPMAKGYAAQHRVGPNAEYIKIAETALDGLL